MADSARKKKKKSKKSTPAVVEHTGGLRDYLEQSRELRTSLVLVIPLFILYQLGVMFTGGVRNGVDFVTSAMWWATQENLAAYLGVNVLILLAFTGGVWAMKGKGLMNPKLWPAVLVESTVYAFFFGGAVVQLMSVFGLDGVLAQGAGGAGDLGLFQKFVLSIGAGLYEEVVFRLIGVGGLFWVLTKFAGERMPSWARAVVAVLVSSVIFSAIHYIGSMGDAFTMGSFLFRFFAGILLAVIFYLRGFAVAVYTHAIYDIIVMVFKGG